MAVVTLEGLSKRYEGASDLAVTARTQTKQTKREAKKQRRRLS